MSRIYEALKQGSPRQGGDGSEAPRTTLGPPGSAAGKTLEEYPVERDNSLDEEPRIEREAVRSISSTPRAVTRDHVALVDERRWEAPLPHVAPVATKLVSTTVHKGSLVSVEPGHKLIVDDDLPAGWAESFVDLARALEETRNTRPLKTLMVMSTQRGEGRTLTAVNLALAFSERLGRRVLLIDGDVHRPSVGRLFNQSPPFRLSDILQPSTREVPVAEVSPTLAVLGTEPSNVDAMTVLASNGMSTLLKAASHYDWVLIDTPPLHSLPEAHMLSWMGDGVLLVIGAHTTHRKAVHKAVQDLGGRNRIVGVMLNRA